MRKLNLLCIALALLACGPPAAAQRRAKARDGVPCPDPTVACRTNIEFQPYQLPFRIPANAVIYESELFYAVILKSVRDPSKGGDCQIFVPEADRLEAQALFPRNKVFASRCSDPGDLYYTNVAQDRQFMAVHAGRTLAEAQQMLAKVKATGKYPGANIRRMRAAFNGT